MWLLMGLSSTSVPEYGWGLDWLAGSWQQNVVLQLVESAITEVRSLFIYLCVLI